jgi:hypothetical protein
LREKERERYHNTKKMGRAPCCDKANVKKGPWSPEEDATLKSYIETNGTGGNWIALPQKIGKCTPLNYFLQKFLLDYINYTYIYVYRELYTIVENVNLETKKCEI